MLPSPTADPMAARMKTRRELNPPRRLSSSGSAVARPAVTHTPEQRRILALCSTQFESVAEVSAHLRLPVGVVRVVVGDLLESGQVRVHGLTSSSPSPPAASCSACSTCRQAIVLM